MDKEQAEKLKRRRIVEGESDTSKTELKTMRRSNNLLRQDESHGEWNRSKEWNLFVKENIRILQKPVRRNEKYKKVVYTTRFTGLYLYYFG